MCGTARSVSTLPLQIFMRQDEQCKVLCRIDSLSKAQAKAFTDKISDDYKVNM